MSYKCVLSTLMKTTFAIALGFSCVTCGGGGDSSAVVDPPPVDDGPEPPVVDAFAAVESPQDSLFISDVLVPENLATAIGVLVEDLTGDAAGESIFSLLTPEDFVVINFTAPVGEQLNECSVDSIQCFVLGPDEAGSAGMFRVFVGNDTFGAFNPSRAVGVNLARFGFQGEFLLAPLFATIETIRPLENSFLAFNDDFTLLEGGIFNCATDLSIEFIGDSSSPACGLENSTSFIRVPFVIDGITNAYTNEVIGRVGNGPDSELPATISAGQIGFTMTIDNAIASTREAYLLDLENDATIDDSVADLASLEAAVEASIGDEIDAVFAPFEPLGIPSVVTFPRPPL